MSYERFYPTLDRCYRLGRYLLQEILTEIAVYAGQDRILCALPPDHFVIQSELGRSLCMDERTLHRSLKYLEKCYYIRQRDSSRDMRVSNITLTRQGRTAVEIIHHTYGIVGKQMCVGLSGADLVELNRLLELATRREYELRARKLDLREVLDRGRF